MIFLAEMLLKVMQKHLSIILKLHQSGTNAAFLNFSTWINEGVDDLKFPKHIYERVSEL